MRYLSTDAVRSFTVPTYFGGTWEVTMWVEFDDPHDSWYNQINAYVSVYHPGTGYSYHQIYYRNGTQGDDPGSLASVDFSVAEGDTISIDINGAWSFDSDSHVRFTQRPPLSPLIRSPFRLRGGRASHGVYFVTFGVELFNRILRAGGLWALLGGGCVSMGNGNVEC